MVQKRFGTSARRKLLPLCGPFLASYELAHFLVKFLQNPPVEFQNVPAGKSALIEEEKRECRRSPDSSSIQPWTGVDPHGVDIKFDFNWSICIPARAYTC
jgi:hypothetical protein